MNSYYKHSESNLTPSVDGNDLNYATVSNFNVNNDRIGLYYYDFGDSPISAVNRTKRTGSSAGVASLTQDRTFIEDDANSSFSGLTGFDKVSEIKTNIADAIQSFTTGSDRLMYAHYAYDESNDQNFALIAAADFDGLGSTGDLTSGDAFEVVGVARLLDVAEGSLGTLGGFNLSRTKDVGLGGV